MKSDALTLLRCDTTSPTAETSHGADARPYSWGGWQRTDGAHPQRGGCVHQWCYGPEFTLRRMLGWAEERKITLIHIQPGRPMQNGHVESFHGRLRDECLNAHRFRTLNDVRQTLEQYCLGSKTLESIGFG